jgi:hypothetical protein
MYVPPRFDDLPRVGLRLWTAAVALAGVCVVWFNVLLLRFLPKLENTPESRIAFLEDVARIQLVFAIAGLMAGLAAHAAAWRRQRRASFVLCGVAGVLFGAAMLPFAVTF